MGLITFEEEKCKRDGICAGICPLSIIVQKDPQSVPETTEDAEQICIRCGHCVACCPHGALSHQHIPVDSCPPYQKELQLSQEHVEHFLRARRSIRSYSDKKVDRKTIEKLIEIARYAPSGHNFQPVKWQVIYDTTEVRRLAGMVIDWCRHLIEKGSSFAELMHMARIVKAWDDGKEIICQGAPHVIVAYGHKKDGTASTASTIALTYLDLAATAFSLGTCWAGLFSLAANVWPAMTSVVNLPKDHTVYGAMMIGHPQINYHRLPLRKPPTITWL